MNSVLPSHTWYPEPVLAFHPDRTTDREVHPLRGLVRFGPHSADFVLDPLRVATITPADEADGVNDFMRRLKSPQRARERRDYLPNWPGFRSIFGLHVRAAHRECLIQLDRDTDRAISNASTPHLVLAEAILRAIQRLEVRRTEFDVVLIYLPERWSAGYFGADGEDFDLHDHLKASTAARGIPIQLIRDKALTYGCQASVMWRIGIALYVKAGGVPWKLADTYPDTAHIGISYAVRPPESDQPRFVTCCSQVFDAEGAGLEFVAYNVDEVEVQRENPFLSRTEMFRVMTRSLDLYRRRHAGRSPSRVMVHKTTEFKREEIEGSLEALHRCDEVDLVQVVQNVGWRGVRIDAPRRQGEKGAPAGYPVHRGTLIDLGPREALLWTHGDVPRISERGSYFQGGRSAPRPIRLIRHAGHGPWDETARAVLGLSKMNWNNDSLYDRLPVTIGYAGVLAKVLKRMPNLRSTPYQFRFFM